VRTHVRVVLAYTVLGLILTWPLIARLTTHVPGDGIDDPSLAWNLWWVKHALVDQPQNPFQCAWQFWPVGINLAFYTLTILNGLLSIPLQGAFGLIPAYNLLLLTSFVLSGLGAYLLALDMVGAGPRREHRHAAAFVAGALYAFASAKLFYAALGQGNIASSQWAPFAALYILRTARAGGRNRDAALAALFLALQAYAELTYASFLLIFATLALIAGVHRASRGKRRRRREMAVVTGRFAAMGILFVLAIAPVLANMLPDLRAEGDFFTSGGGFADVFSADLVGYLVPTQLHPLLGGIVRQWSAASGFPVDKGQHIYAGYTALALAAVGLESSRRRGLTLFWAGSAFLFFLLTLGPSLRIAGIETGIPLPFRVMEVLPFFKGNRYPSRYSVMLLLSLAPLIAAGTSRVLAWTGRARAAWPRAATPAITAVLLTALLLFEHLSAPLPVFDLRVPPLYQRVAAEAGDFALLELPLGWRNGARVAGKQDVLIMQQLWYQSTHGKRVLGGNTSRNPEFKFQYFSENPILARLIAMTNAADLQQHEALREHLQAAPITGDDRALARQWAAFTNIRYVMVHRDKAPAQVEALIRDLLPLSLEAEEGQLALYRVGAMPPPRSFELNADAGRVALGEGWSTPQGGDGRNAGGMLSPVYAQRAEVRLLLPLGADAGRLRIRAAALVEGQRVSLVVDGKPGAEQALSAQGGTLTWDISADRRRPPLSDVRLRFDGLTSVTEIGLAAGRPRPFSLLVRSAGQEAGDFGHIYVNGVEHSPNRRGYNLVALQQPSGELLAAASFDTHADGQASRLMAEWLDRVPAGALVAGAVRDEASQRLDQAGVDALIDLRLSVDLRGHFRWGHAFVASTEGGASERLERVGAVTPVQLSWGPPLSSPQVAAEVFSVELLP
jgi:hypothetical protein